jgi:hypothetical protein
MPTPASYYSISTVVSNILRLKHMMEVHNFSPKELDRMENTMAIYFFDFSVLYEKECAI